MSAPQPSESKPAATQRESAPSNSDQSEIVNRTSYFVRFLAYRRLWIVGVLVFVADQVTKSMIAARLPFGSYGPGAHIEIFPGLLNLVHVGNTGAAWSMFSGMSAWLGLLALGTLGAMFFWRHTLGLHHAGIQPAFGLLSGGIVGNLVDRFAHGHVIDFLDFHFGNYTYPTFNVADSGICVGVFWYVLWSLRQPAPTRET